MRRRGGSFTVLVGALACALLLAVTAAGCGSESGVSDSKIVSALGLKQAGHGYEMGGDPFCTIDRLLNDGDEVHQADDHPGGSGFVIAGSKGTVGVLARRPFAPNCIRQAKEGLKHVEKQSG
jgi:hypothetical protein